MSRHGLDSTGSIPYEHCNQPWVSNKVANLLIWRATVAFCSLQNQHQLDVVPTNDMGSIPTDMTPWKRGLWQPTNHTLCDLGSPAKKMAISVTHSLTHSPSHTKRITWGHNFTSQPFHATSCRLIHNIKVAHSAERPHALREVTKDSCQIKINILYKADRPQNLGMPDTKSVYADSATGHSRGTQQSNAWLEVRWFRSSDILVDCNHQHNSLVDCGRCSSEFVG
jgi:hypothetical protein